ncbi:MAG TPA: type III pantothenate kinase [Anaerolineae bacterium]|nr:type III pantothenate kinase [Anaerolineae bacterium]
MLLACDIGNTNIVLGVYDEEQLGAHWRIQTNQDRMPDEYAVLLRQLFDYAGLPWSHVSDVIISSVVPPLTTTFVELSERYLSQHPLIVDANTRTGVRVRTDNPAEVGADRIVNTAAVYHLYGGPAIVIDFGTATTFDVVSSSGDYLGGAIAPGLSVSAEALVSRTAKLPRIELVAPPRAIGTNTIAAMQAGLMYGYVGLVEGLVARLQDELVAAGEGMPRVIATGGLAELVAHETQVIEAVEPWLTLTGLRLIWKMIQGKG